MDVLRESDVDGVIVGAQDDDDNSLAPCADIRSSAKLFNLPLVLIFDPRGVVNPVRPYLSGANSVARPENCEKCGRIHLATNRRCHRQHRFHPCRHRDTGERAASRRQCLDSPRQHGRLVDCPSPRPLSRGVAPAERKRSAARIRHGPVRDVGNAGLNAAALADYARPMQIEIVSDTVCPWCFIGKRRFERALAERPGLDINVSWLPFQLNPDMPPEGLDRKSYLGAKFGSAEATQRVYARVREAGVSEGVDFDFDAIERSPNTIDSHRLILWAGELGYQDAIVEYLFKAYFLDGRDIGDQAVLIEVAGDAGMDAGQVAGLLAQDQDRGRVLDECNRAVQIGVSGVPCFIFDRRFSVSGAQDPAVFLQVFDTIAGESSGAAASSVP